MGIPGLTTFIERAGVGEHVHLTPNDERRRMPQVIIGDALALVGYLSISSNDLNLTVADCYLLQ